MKCPTCEDEWPENYCPVCKCTITNPTSQSQLSDLKKTVIPPADSVKSAPAAYWLSRLNTSISDPNQEEIIRTANKNIIIGSIWLIAGISITLFSLLFYSAGGSFYVVTWGAIVYGILRITRGSKLLNKW